MSTGSESVDYDAISYVVSSDYRVAVVERLQNSPQIPSGIATDTGHEISHISRALGDLRDRGMVELLVSQDRKKGRVYGLTEKGERVAEDPDGILGIGGEA